jgi:hypothetical protein
LDRHPGIGRLAARYTLAQMLAIRRTTVTLVAGNLEKDGAIMQVN